MERVDALVVGAGFAGLYALHRLREIGLEARGVDAASDVGGTWYWNRYPGARCDIPSMEYSYSFDADLQNEWDWQERYASQPEILAYLRHVADRFSLRELIDFDTSIISAAWDDGGGRWKITAADGRNWSAQFLVLATGCLSVPLVPDIPGLESFAGPLLTTGRWPHEPIDLTGQRVGVIGTGSSGVQAIPEIAAQAKHLTVFQRTPGYAVPARNRALGPDERADIRGRYADFREANKQRQGAFGSDRPRAGPAGELTESEQVAELVRNWEHGGFAVMQAFEDVMLDPAANELVADFLRARIRDRVHDPAVAERLMPDTMVGCKRLLVETDYFETYNRSNVTLVDLREDPIEEATADGVRLASGPVALDVLVLATGFDAMTGAITRIDPVGRDGESIRGVWGDGPVTYLGLCVPGFPNMFTITGPGSPSVLTNMVVSIEQHVDFIADLISDMQARERAVVDSEPRAARRWGRHVDLVASFTVFPHCNSWYLGANVPGKPRRFLPLPGFPDYVTRCDAVAADDYAGFVFDGDDGDDGGET